MKKYFTKFLNQNKDILHFAGHSHHYWPDISLEGHQQYWVDSSIHVDEKWNKIFTQIIPTAQQHICQMTGIQKADRICFAPNTHELVARLLFTLLHTKERPLKILTTDSEFHSFSRQLKRLQEDKLVEVTIIEASTLESFERLPQKIKQLSNHNYDLFFISHVFFNSGLKIKDSDLTEIFDLFDPTKTTLCLDTYHGFATQQLNFAALEEKVFILAGGYKYAMAGEGACWMSIPNHTLRPIQTGWFAGFSDLQKEQSEISYANNGMAFMGATQDFSGLYRFNAIWDFFYSQNISVDLIHQRVIARQKQFIDSFESDFLPPIMNTDLNIQGHFLSFELEDGPAMIKTIDILNKKNIVTDGRGKRLRFGFSCFHDPEDIENLLNKIKFA